MHAAPYASGLRFVSGTTYEFVLNEGADRVVIERDGGAPIDLGSLGKGRHSFDLGGAAEFDIVVSRNAPSGYVLADDTAELWTSFDRPGGLQINAIPSSPYFGTIYVNQNRGATFGPLPTITTADGRTVGNGIYSLTADRVGVNLPDSSVPLDVNDVSLAKTGGVEVDSISSNSFYRIGMDDAGNLIAGDWTNGLGGLKYVSADLTSGGELFSSDTLTNNRAAGGVIASDSNGPFGMHGSVGGEPQVRGSFGVDLVVSAMDEDLDADQDTQDPNDGNAVWSWSFGAATTPQIVRPELVIAPGDLHTSAGQDRSTSGVTFPVFSENPAGTHSDGTPVFLDYNIGVRANAQYNEHFDKWYLSGSRGPGNDSSSLVVLTPEGPGGDGRDIQVDWASKQFTIDNGFDGFSVADPQQDPSGLSSDPHNDIFRNVHNVAFSPDNKTMYVQRRLVTADNPVLGTGGALGATVLAIPLDENGLPDIEVDDNGTPGDPSDDFLANVTPLFTGAEASIGSLSQVKTDAAGNVYYSGNVVQRLQYFSLGGHTIATTSNNAALTGGAFSVTVVPEPATVLLVLVGGVLAVRTRR